MNDRICWFMIYAVLALVGFFIGVYPVIIWWVG